jgi:hypothetical protein
MQQYTLTTRSSVSIWTADRSGEMKRGDIVLMYGARCPQAYVAIARACSAPRCNDRAQRLRKNREFWVYLQVQPLQAPVPRQTVEQQGFAQMPGSGIQTPRGSRANRVSVEAIRGFSQLLHDRDDAAAARLGAWIAGRGRYPAERDVEELRWAEWERPTFRSPRELLLSRKIAERLVKSGDFRFLTPDDVQLRRRFGSNTAYSLEHPIRDMAGPGYVDILLVDLRRRPPTLLAIEVKIQASMRPGRNPIPQVIRYREALRSSLGSTWRIDALAVAEHFHHDVLDEARRASVPLRECLPSGRLKTPF